MGTFEHAGLGFTSEELLTALVAERLDRLADRMVRGGLKKLAVLGRLEHAAWLHENVYGMRVFPIAGYVVNPWIEEEHGEMWHGVPVMGLADPRLGGLADTVLISDDLYEDALWAEALRVFKPGVTIHRLYDRLAIGNVPAGRVVVRGVGAGGAQGTVATTWASGAD